MAIRTGNSMLVVAADYCFPLAAVATAARSVAPTLVDAVGVLRYAAWGPVHADPGDLMPLHEVHALPRELATETVETILASAGPGRCCAHDALHWLTALAKRYDPAGVSR